MALPRTKPADPSHEHRPEIDQESNHPIPESPNEPETPFGRRLMKIHEEIVASGQPLIDTWEELEREIADRRGGQSGHS